MVSGYQNGTIAQLLQAIIGQINFDGEPISNIGDILLSILEQTPYDDEPKSVLAELFLKLKDKLEGRAFTPYDKEPTSVIAEILLSILNETEYDKEPNSRIAELLLELKAELESYAEITVSGAIANFTTSVVKPLVNLKAHFEATGGGGTPASPIAISGVSAVSVYHCGANLFDEVMELGVLDSNGNIQSSTTNLVSTNKFAVKGGATLYFSCVKKTSTSQRYGVAFYDKDENFISDSGSIVQTSTFTPPQNACFMRFFVPLSWYVSSTYENDISVNYPATDTDYHAYNPNSNVTLINLNGTYYGGYVEQDKDGKRELVVTHEITDLGEQTWTYSVWGAGYVFTANLSAAKEQAVSGVKGDIICSIYNNITASEMYNSNPNYSMCLNMTLVRIANSDYSDKDVFKTAMNGIMLVYELAEPFTVALPDGEPIIAFNGVNNVWNDTGDTNVTYLAKIEDNLRSTAKFRANLKAEKQKLKEQKELKELEEKETIKEPTKEIGETKK